MPCPNCGAPMREGFFLCMRCADTIPDSVVIDIAALVDDGASAQQAFDEISDQMGD